MWRSLSTSFVVAALVSVGRPARAEEKPPAPAAPEERSAYVGFSPIHLSRPIAELTGEVRLHRRVGVAVIGGAGTIGDGSNRAAYWNVGGQLLTYIVGSFDYGLQLGIEAMYAGMAKSRDAVNLITGAVNAFAVGPIIGGKVPIAGGFTMSTQAGASYVPAYGRVAALYNLNLGWAF